jgi:adenylate cyclase
MTATRRLAAILAADVAGYSRLMGADEEGTHERVKLHRREVADPKIGEHSGRIVKTTGDGILAEFSSVVDAVRCAAELQRGMIDREAGITAANRITEAACPGPLSGRANPVAELRSRLAPSQEASLAPASCRQI